jgi:Protein of unknown function (DUF3592)
MFEDLLDALSFLGSWRWPEAVGEVTDAITERIGQGSDERYRLAVAYKFSVGTDGPYTGESFWQPRFFGKRRVIAARKQFRLHQPIAVRYRPDDPSVNRLDKRTWAGP